MTLLARGCASKQIAGELGVSEVTVRVHRSQIMQKMGARSLVDLVRMSDRVKADDGSPLDAVPESTHEGLPRTNRTARRVTGKQKGRGSLTK